MCSFRRIGALCVLLALLSALAGCGTQQTDTALPEEEAQKI